MSDTPIVQRLASAHLAWLACLYAAGQKIRREGLMSIECDVEMPEHAESIFQRFPQTLEQPYLEFATDVLRMMVGGNLNADEMKVYAEHYIGGLLAKGGFFPSAVDESLLRTIWLTLWALMCGYAPQVASEFGRQAVPLKLKPKFVELEDQLKKIRAVSLQQGKPFRQGGLDAAADSFVASLAEK
jgi:flagellar motor component MotA